MPRTKAQKLPVPTESAEQIMLFQWVALQLNVFPELARLYHIPNGGKRYVTTAKRLKAEGVKAGVPDLCLPVPRGGFHGLYIEMKRREGNDTTDNQDDWLEFLASQGYCTAVCRGWDAASEVLVKYLKMRAPERKGALHNG